VDAYLLKNQLSHAVATWTTVHPSLVIRFFYMNREDVTLPES